MSPTGATASTVAPWSLAPWSLTPWRFAPWRLMPSRSTFARSAPRRSAAPRLAPWFTAISRASRHDGASIENNSAVFNNRLRISILMAAPPSSSRPHQVVPDHAGHAEAESAVVTSRSIGHERFERCGDASEFLRYFSEKIDVFRGHRLNLLRPHGKHVRNGDAPMSPTVTGVLFVSWILWS